MPHKVLVDFSQPIQVFKNSLENTLIKQIRSCVKSKFLNVPYLIRNGLSNIFNMPNWHSSLNLLAYGQHVEGQSL